MRTSSSSRWIKDLASIGARVSIGAAGVSLATAVLVVACGDEDDCGVEQNPPVGYFSDSPLPALCPSDTFQVSPGPVIVLRGAAGTTAMDAGGGGGAQVADEGGAGAGGAPGTASGGSSGGDDGGSGSPSSSSVRVAIIGHRVNGQPHESANVDISSCGAPNIITLSATTDSTLAGGCKAESGAIVHCVLNSSGVATFSVTAVPGANGPAVLCPSSGNRPYPKVGVQVGTPPASLDSVGFLTNSTAALVVQPSPMQCGSSPPPSLMCGNLTSNPITLESRAIVTTTDPGMDASALVQPLTPTGPVQVRLAVVPSSGAANSVWLAATSDCLGGRPLTAPIAFDGTSPLSSSVYLCSDGAQGSATVIASYPSLRGTGIQEATFSLPGVPASLEVAAPTGAGPDGGASGGTVQLVASDCRGRPIAGAIVALSTGAADTTLADGTVRLGFPVADAGVTVASATVSNPALLAPPSSCSSIVLGGGSQ